MVYLTGDTHRCEDIHKLGASLWKSGKSLTKDDYLIILGDFGLVWSRPESSLYKEELYWQKWLHEQCSWTTLFVDGNHENHEMLYELPEVEMFGSKVGKVNDSIYHLKRGEIYEIEFKKYFVCGGAFSIDKNTRTPGVSWWKEELPSTAEFEHGLKNLEARNWEVDYILGHTCPYKIGRLYLRCMMEVGNKLLQQIDVDTNIELTGEQLAYLSFDDEYYSAKLDAVGKYFDSVVENTKFKKFYFGHFHSNWCTKGEKYIMLYEDIVLLDEIKPEWKVVWE